MYQKYFMVFVLACLSILLSVTAIGDTKDSIEPDLANQTKSMQQKLPEAQKEKPRGQLLYENHCGGCHETSVHGRDPRKATSIPEIRHWINTWQKELKLNWSQADIDDVTNYINFKYYHFTK
ncbi:c-type cytochrome [Kaarinaea lacus]